MKGIFRWYFGVPLIVRIIVCFVAGAGIGGVIWYLTVVKGVMGAEKVIAYISPFGTVFVNMLRMVVIPIVLFSLVTGAASLPIRKFGRVGLKTIGWYLSCSLLAAVVGISLAMAFNPGAETKLGNWERMAEAGGVQASNISGRAAEQNTVTQILLNLFRNPFEALSEGNFLPVIVFAIMFGLAMRVCMESGSEEQVRRMETLEGVLEACRDAMFKAVDWILEYSPVGVLALSITNFGLHGPSIVGPYVSITAGVIAGILCMVIVVYPALLWGVTRQNPLPIMKRCREAMLMAFVTRSSAATLPVSMKVAREELKIREELASFSLPLGATINMDGVCVHLPMFAILAANMFGIQLTAGRLGLLVVTTVLSSIGAGGVPGGSLMLLFVILGTLGLTSQQTAIIVALAVGINPILDMFETMNNVTGDLVCTYVVAHNEKLLGADS